MRDLHRNLSNGFFSMLASIGSLGCYSPRMTQASRPFRQWFTSTAVCLAIGGCGGEMKIAPVSGTVTLDGEPFERAYILFSPEKGHPSYAITDSNGRYTLQYYYSGVQKGAEVGECLVKITPVIEGEDEVPKAASPTQTVRKLFVEEPITVTVEPTRNTIDIDLTRKP